MSVNDAREIAKQYSIPLYDEQGPNATANAITIEFTSWDKASKQHPEHKERIKQAQQVIEDHRSQLAHEAFSDKLPLQLKTKYIVFDNIRSNGDTTDDMINTSPANARTMARIQYGPRVIQLELLLGIKADSILHILPETYARIGPEFRLIPVTVAKVIDKDGTPYTLKQISIRSYQAYDNLTKRLLSIACQRIVTLRALKDRFNVEQIINTYFSADGNYLYIMEEFYDYTLYSVVSYSSPLDDAQKKWIAFQLLNGIAEMHNVGFVHDNITLRTVLINTNLALIVDEIGSKQDTENITSNQLAINKPPESRYIGFGSEPSMNIWEAGHIIAELYLGPQRVFYGNMTLAAIVDSLPESAAQFAKHETSDDRRYILMHKHIQQLLEVREEKFTMNEPLEERLVKANAPAEAIELILSLLSVDPDQRPSAHEAMNARWFSEDEDYIKDGIIEDHLQIPEPTNIPNVSNMKSDELMTMIKSLCDQ